MTNKEAISELSALMTHYNAFSKESEAVGVAIKAIEREPIPDDCEILTKEAYSDLCLRAAKAEREECEDCISRQATLDEIIKELCIKDESYLLQAERKIYYTVKYMPSVKPKRDDAKDDLK